MKIYYCYRIITEIYNIVLCIMLIKFKSSYQLMYIKYILSVDKLKNKNLLM